MDFLGTYGARYGLGLGAGPAGPTLDPIGYSAPAPTYSAPAYVAPEPAYVAPAVTIREPLHEHYQEDYVHAHADYVERDVIVDVPVQYDETEYQIAHKIEYETRTR